MNARHARQVPHPLTELLYVMLALLVNMLT